MIDPEMIKWTLVENGLGGTVAIARYKLTAEVEFSDGYRVTSYDPFFEQKDALEKAKAIVLEGLMEKIRQAAKPE